ncbi:hypothetical protein BN2475_400030 [Paraburkholderia ribeironis]|uniref:Uncharacterized protein n=1 Tax=Paraburkholderia ribeironis TaxID=1247936 RepID=A0A1N7S6K8_9BURK|nr:hypothetical protein BN2475_400030 [Paraburkholderia ribeironis]
MNLMKKMKKIGPASHSEAFSGSLRLGYQQFADNKLK